MAPVQMERQSIDRPDIGAVAQLQRGAPQGRRIRSAAPVQAQAQGGRNAAAYRPGPEAGETASSDALRHKQSAGSTPQCRQPRRSSAPWPTAGRLEAGETNASSCYQPWPWTSASDLEQQIQAAPGLSDFLMKTTSWQNSSLQKLLATHLEIKANWVSITLVVPIVVVPDGLLWKAEYSHDGKLSQDPSQTDACEF